MPSRSIVDSQRAERGKIHGHWAGRALWNRFLRGEDQLTTAGRTEPIAVTWKEAVNDKISQRKPVVFGIDDSRGHRYDRRGSDRFRKRSREIPSLRHIERVCGNGTSLRNNRLG